jgi:hypothetical protein
MLIVSLKAAASIPDGLTPVVRIDLRRYMNLKEPDSTNFIAIVCHYGTSLIVTSNIRFGAIVVTRFSVAFYPHLQ